MANLQNLLQHFCTRTISAKCLSQHSNPSYTNQSLSHPSEQRALKYINYQQDQNTSSVNSIITRYIECSEYMQQMLSLSTEYI